MTVQTMRGTQAQIRISLTGHGVKHWHLVLSRTTGLNGATVARAYDNQESAIRKAYACVETFEAEGYRATERRDGTVIELSRGDVKRYLFVRPCYLRHAR
jgi:hypothetical protein